MKRLLASSLLLSCFIYFPCFSFAAASSILTCHSFGSFETFELSPPDQIRGAYRLQIVDMAQLEPQALALKGTVELHSFDVLATEPNYRTGPKDMGRMLGRQHGPTNWEMTWYPATTALNGAKMLKFSCSIN